SHPSGARAAEIGVQNPVILLWRPNEVAMQPSSSSLPALPEAWAQVLDSVDETLRTTEQGAAEREEALKLLCPLSQEEEEHMARQLQIVHSLEEQMQRWPTARQAAEKEALEADAVLS